MKGRARGARDAMIGPEHLLAAVKGDCLEGLAARMRACERDVPLGVPILSRDYAGESARVEQVADGYENRVATPDPERTAWEEIILDVDDQQRRIRNRHHR